LPAGLSGTRPLPSGADIGDFDEDGDVDGTDFLNWQRTENSIAAELATWQENFGQLRSQALEAIGIPEPAGWILLCSGGWILGIGRW